MEIGLRSVCSCGAVARWIESASQLCANQKVPVRFERASSRTQSLRGSFHVSPFLRDDF